METKALLQEEPCSEPQPVSVALDVGKVELNADATTTIVGETKENLLMAIPLILTTILEFLPFGISVILVGHIDSPYKKEYVDAASMSYLVLNFTGASIGFGLLSALDTLCSQSVGAGRLYNLGMYFQSGLIVMGFICIPMFLCNWNAGLILELLHQTPEVVKLTDQFNKLAVLGMPGLFTYELMKKCLQAQGIVNPMVWIAAADNVLYACLGYYLCSHTSLGFYGAAIARSICYLLLPVFGYIYLCWNPKHKEWWPEDHSVSSQWKAAWDHVPELLTLGVPGMLMMLMESCAFDIAVISVGWMPNPVLSLAIYNVLMNIYAQIFAIYLGLGMACTIRVGNALGANEPNRARTISNASLLTVILVMLVLATVFLAAHDKVPYLFISDPVAIDGIQNAFGVFLYFMAFDGVNAICQSILRGMGRQAIGAYVNAGAYYLCGIPLAFLLGFYYDWGVQGTWFGLASGLCAGVAIYLVIIFRSDWRQLANEAVERTDTDKA